MSSVFWHDLGRDICANGCGFGNFLAVLTSHEKQKLRIFQLMYTYTSARAFIQASSIRRRKQRRTRRTGRIRDMTQLNRVDVTWHVDSTYVATCWQRWNIVLSYFARMNATTRNIFAGTPSAYAYTVRYGYGVDMSAIRSSAVVYVSCRSTSSTDVRTAAHV